MNEDENISAYFLKIDEIVNARKGLGKKIEEHGIVSKVIWSVLPKFETKISTLQENKSFPK